MQINIKYFDKQDPLIINPDGNWIDLKASETVFIEQNTAKLIPLGIAMQLPPSTEAWLTVRSSTFKNWGIIQLNPPGIIDESYCGDKDEWKFSAYCLQSHDCENGKSGSLIRKGDRICQFRLMTSMDKQEFANSLTIVSKLENNSRGGFGSTGKS